LFGKFIISSDVRELNGVGKLPVDAVPELKELPEFEPPKVDPEPDEETAALVSEEFDVA
jgi:hypothetical protein